jgi:hypothetical protein
MEEKARDQQYLKPYEEDVVVKYLLQMSDLGQPIRIKFIPFIAFRVTRHRPTTDRPLKPPGRNWTKALEKRHPELVAAKSRAVRPSLSSIVTTDPLSTKSLVAALVPQAGRMV